MALVTALLLTSCAGPGAGAEDGCPGIAARHGVGVDVRPPLSRTVDRARLRLCWRGACRTLSVTLRPATRTVRGGCSGDVCSARSTPTGALTGFADVADLPGGPVRATLTLRNRAGATVLQGTVRATPGRVHAGGRACDPEGTPQLRLRVTGSGRLLS